MPVYTCLYLSIPVYTCIFLYIPVYTCLYLSIPVYTCLYLPKPVFICQFLSITVYNCLYLSMPVYICIYLSIPVSTCLYLSKTLLFLLLSDLKELQQMQVTATAWLIYNHVINISKNLIHILFLSKDKNTSFFHSNWKWSPTNQKYLYLLIDLIKYINILEYLPYLWFLEVCKVNWTYSFVIDNALKHIL